MKLEAFLKCKHSIEPDTALTIMRCDHCGVDANVIKYIETLKGSLRFAAGFISGQAGFTNKHPEECYNWIMSSGKSFESDAPPFEIFET